MVQRKETQWGEPKELHEGVVAHDGNGNIFYISGALLAVLSLVSTLAVASAAS